ncbi:GlxA family transcriptional regulator [Sphingosinicella sp. BN140058]|uniref:GlxA family transcriptional regulator n=1 Tax=Sphingosinicella sp. BN140058 TaxID=1892855 RepID=UPI00101202D5|nr:helix-turn-helix domain-containing protein [Sphingosinicella sp. BN140058]QAY77543.1 helix-turn-helix domain-containing protein [Sphingosinicella sp. BN140058]
MHEIAVIAMHGVIPFDLSIPCEVFSRVRLKEGQPGYRVRVCGEAAEVRAGAFGVRSPWTLDAVTGADTIILPGVENPELPVSDAIVDAVRAGEARGARVASICTGAFALAATGLLDGKRATTHWRAAALLAELYPAIEVDASVLFVDHGSIVTSAGAAAGLDMCLHLVRRDHGQAVAAQAARLAVAPLVRDGGQAQYITHQPPRASGGLAPLLEWMLANAHRQLGLAELARHAAMSPRTLGRRFRQETGTTPLQWLIGARIRRAQELLETSTLSVERIAYETGFDGTATLREHFGRLVGVSPREYRRRFAAPSDAAPSFSSSAAFPSASA